MTGLGGCGSKSQGGTQIAESSFTKFCREATRGTFSLVAKIGELSDEHQRRRSQRTFGQKTTANAAAVGVLGWGGLFRNLILLLAAVIIVLGGLAVAAVMGVLWGIGVAVDNARGERAGRAGNGGDSAAS